MSRVIEYYTDEELGPDVSPCDGEPFQHEIHCATDMTHQFCVQCGAKFFTEAELASLREELAREKSGRDEEIARQVNEFWGSSACCVRAEEERDAAIARAEKVERREVDMHKSWSEMFDRALAAEAKFKTARADVLEEAAKYVADSLRSMIGGNLAHRIRALASKPEGDGE